jgi:hypothetical protein
MPDDGLVKTIHGRLHVSHGPYTRDVYTGMLAWQVTDGVLRVWDYELGLVTLATYEPSQWHSVRPEELALSA